MTKGKFSALGRLSDVSQQGSEDASKQEFQETRKLENQVPVKEETEERWEALGTEVRTQTKRRIKAYAGMAGLKIKDVVDEALTLYLDRVSNPS